MIDHAAMIGAFRYRNVLLCGPCVTPAEHRMTGRFYPWPQVRGSGWTCERCGVELESLDPDRDRTQELAERLKRCEHDPSMRHTAARWDLHEALYPGSGAADAAARYRESDAELLAQVRESLAVMREKAPDDHATQHLAWMESELAGTASEPTGGTHVP